MDGARTTIGTATTPGDEALLARWRQARCEDAFAALVARHAAPVRATCERLLGERHPALDDACQGVFLVFARRGGEIRAAGALASWLHRTARRVVGNLRRADRRRRRHERHARDLLAVPAPAAPPEPDAAAALIDDAIAALPDGQREAMLRHALAGRSQAQVAAELGVSEGAVKKRVADAKANLRRWYARRGVAVPAILLLGASSAPAAVPPALATACAGAASGSVAPRALGLADAALRASGAGKLALAATLATAIVIAGALAAAPSAVTPAGSIAPPAATTAGDRAAVVAALAEPIAAIRAFDLRRLDAALGAGERAAMRARWRSFQTRRRPLAEAGLDVALRMARSPVGEALAEMAPPTIALLPRALTDAAAEFHRRREPELARLMLDLAHDFGRAMDPAVLADPQRARQAMTARLATIRLFGITRVDDLRRLDYDALLDRLAVVFASMRAWDAPYGLDFDRLLGSVEVAAVEGDGAERVAVLALEAFGRSHRLRLRCVREDDRWRCPAVDAFVGVLVQSVMRNFSP